jgi:hypothetical protein
MDTLQGNYSSSEGSDDENAVSEQQKVTQRRKAQNASFEALLVSILIIILAGTTNCDTGSHIMPSRTLPERPSNAPLPCRMMCSQQLTYWPSKTLEQVLWIPESTNLSCSKRRKFRIRLRCWTPVFPSLSLAVSPRRFRETQPILSDLLCGPSFLLTCCRIREDPNCSPFAEAYHPQ